MRLPRLFHKVHYVLLTLLILGASISVIPSLTHAQTSLDTSTQTSLNGDTDRVQSTVIGLINSAICLLSGKDIINPQRGCLGIDPVNHKLSYDATSNKSESLGGLLGMSTSYVSGMYVKPVTTMSYISYLNNNFGVGPKTYAQTTNAQGFDNLSSLQSIWITTRNISYFVFTLLFVFIGIAIMLRIKIDPRTVMSIQNQIPKIVIAIIMITFSYAIVGLLVDMMWVSTYTGINVLSSSDTTSGQSVREAATKNLVNNPVAYVWFLFSAPKAPNEKGPDNLIGLSKDVGLSMGNVVASTITEVLGFDQTVDKCSVSWWHPWSAVATCVENGIQGFFKYLIGIIVLLIVLVALFLALFRVWFTLLKSLVYVIIYTIIAPFVIIGGLIPGSTFGFGRWVRTIIANLSVYPVTVFIFLLARIIANSPQVNDAKQTFLPPLVANPGSFTNFGSLIAFGLIMIAPEMLGFMQAAFKAKPGPIGDIVKKGFGAGVGPGTAIPKAMWSRANKYDVAKGELGSLGGLRLKATEGFERKFHMFSSRKRFSDAAGRKGSIVAGDVNRRGLASKTDGTTS